MPSNSFDEFRKNLTDVHRIRLLHTALSHPQGGKKPGKRGLGHLTRAGTVLLCAAWERYVESVLEDGARFLARRCTLATLPQQPRALVTDFVTSGNSSFTAATFAASLEPALIEAVRARTAKLNTPKHHLIRPLFERVLGVVDIAQAWSEPSTVIDAFVSLRGEVAHRGGQAKYVWFAKLKAAELMVERLVVETDNYLSDHLRPLVIPNRRPWNRQQV